MEDHTFDVYLLRRRFKDRAFTGELGRAGDLRDDTLGLRALGKQDRWDYEGELALQRGDYGEDDTKTWMFVLAAGYTFEEMEWTPRLGVEYNFASGDDNPADGDRETFDPLYPSNNAYFGHQDLVGRSNIRDLVLRGRVLPAEGWSLHADYHLFNLDEEQGGWFNAAGNLVRAGSSLADDELGSELDLYARYTSHNLDVGLGVSRFFAGEFVKDTTGRDKDQNWAFVQLTVKF